MCHIFDLVTDGNSVTVTDLDISWLIYIYISSQMVDIDIVTDGWCATVTVIDIDTGGVCASLTNIDIVMDG